MEMIGFRNEIKYLINQYDYLILKSRLSHLLRPDSHSGSYRVRSLYFDDSNNSSLLEKLDGIDDREKYRIRIYNLSDNTIKLERKVRKGQYISKETYPLRRETVENITNNKFDTSLLKYEGLLRTLYLKSSKDVLRPVLIVDYQREAYTFPNDNVRITFDSDLRFPLNSLDIFEDRLPTRSVLPPTTLIIEVKYDRFLPGFIRSLLQTTSATKMSLSKYALCRESNLNQEVKLWMEL